MQQGPLHQGQPMQTPFFNAYQEWDERIGSARVQAANWRMAFFGMLGLSVVLVLGLIYQSKKAQVVPYVIEVAADTGKVRLLGAPTEQLYVPSEEVKKYFLAQWVRDVRGLPHDVYMAREAILRSYKYVTTPKGKLMLDQYFEQAKPLQRVGQASVQVEVHTVVEQSPTTYQVEWEERSYGQGGIQLDVQQYTGIFELVHEPPSRAEVLRDNPLGLYLNHISFTRRPMVTPVAE
jgi:type IV secretion system protein TrbF